MSQGWGTFLLAAATALVITGGTGAPQARAEDVPRFLVDPFWPKLLPDNWILGQVAGVSGIRTVATILQPGPLRAAEP
jgi:hypothetical protein